MVVRNFKDLRVWKLGMTLALEIQSVSNEFPKSEWFGLRSQIRRCAVSIPSNIAEGFYRFSKTDFRRFLSISLGSCGELETQLEFAFRLNYISQEKFSDLQETLEHEIRMIKKLINH